MSEYRARIPADVEAPDKILYGLNARQVAILGTAAALSYMIFQSLHEQVPMPALLGGLIPLGGIAAMLALGVRDGLPLDRWLMAAMVFKRSPRRAVPAAGVAKSPSWAPRVDPPPIAPTALRLPAQAITPTGLVNLGGGTSCAIVAATTVNLGLRTAEEQTAIIAAYARWLNSLEGPAQIVVSAQHVDLTSHATRIADDAAMLPHPALSDAALGYAEFLVDLELQRDPLWRTVTITHTATGARRDTDALRRAEHTTAALPALGSATRLLDGPTALGVLTTAVDPYQPTADHPGRALPHQPITAPGDPT